MPDSNGVHAFYTVAEVAELLRVHSRTVARDIRAGLLTATSIRRRIRISQADLEKYIKGQRATWRRRRNSQPRSSPKVRRRKKRKP